MKDKEVMSDKEFASIVFLMKINKYLAYETAFNDIIDIRVGNEVIKHYNDINARLSDYLEKRIVGDKYGDKEDTKGI